VERIPVVSNILAEIGYDATSRTLSVLFKSGAVYLYYFVPQAAYDALMAADSPAIYFNKQIKGIYEHHRIAEPRIVERPSRRLRATPKRKA
jgi:KTSC domain